MFCYHWDLTDGVCDKCGTPVTVTPGHTVRVGFGTNTESLPVWIAGTDTPTLAQALGEALGVAPTDVTMFDVGFEGEYWERRTRVRFTLRGSRVELSASLIIVDTDRKDPERTELDPVTGSPVEPTNV